MEVVAIASSLPPRCRYLGSRLKSECHFQASRNISPPFSLCGVNLPNPKKMQLPCLVKFFGKCRRMISRDKKQEVVTCTSSCTWNIVSNSTPQWICMIPSNRRYQIRTYKLCLCLTYLTCPIQHFTHQQDSRQNTLLSLSYSMADPPLSPTSTTSEPLPIAIIGMYVEIHASISYIHFHREVSFLTASFLHSYKQKENNKINRSRNRRSRTCYRPP